MRAPGHILSNTNLKNPSSHTRYLKGFILNPWKGTSKKKQEHQNHPLDQNSDPTHPGSEGALQEYVAKKSSKTSK